MPGRSSTVPGDTFKMESPAPLLGAAGQAGGMDQQDGVKDERHSTTHSAPHTTEGACRREQYCILVRIETARDKKPLQAHAWGEALLKDFFQATIGILYAIIIISPIECMLFALGSIQGARHVLRGFQDTLPTVEWHPPLGWLCRGGHHPPEDGQGRSV